MSDKHLKLDPKEIKAKVSGMAGDGAFCKKNKPFEDRMKNLFEEPDQPDKKFNFKWDLLHLYNRSHIKALDKQKEFDFSLNTVMDIIQNHSKEHRSGLDYTNHLLDELFDFKRPKLKSDTRLVNYDFEQVSRFLHNQVYFDHPYNVLCLSRMFLPITYLTKVILKIAQKVDVSNNFMHQVFYEEKAKPVMKKVLDIGYEIGSQGEIDEIVKKYQPVKPEGQKKFTDVADYLLDEVCIYITKNKRIVKTYPDDAPEKGLTRKSKAFTPVIAKEILSQYIEDLWQGISKRLTYFEKDGTTRWCEAPSEGIFSILEYIVENKPSLQYKHMISLCRVVLEGPPPGTEKAQTLTVNALEQWRDSSKDGLAGRFASNDWIKGLTSKTSNIF